MIEERKNALLFAATILAARKLANLSDTSDPTPAKLCAVESNSGKLGDDRNSDRQNVSSQKRKGRDPGFRP